VGFLFANFQEQRQIEREDRLRNTSIAATSTRQEENSAATDTRRVENDATAFALGTAHFEGTATRQTEDKAATATRQASSRDATATQQVIQTDTAEENAAAQSTLEANRLNEDILEAYFDDMSTLILETENIAKAGTIERARDQREHLNRKLRSKKG
jgi:hypothetical protein